MNNDPILHQKTFRELTVDELYELLRVRSEVFVVEQDCVYQDLDGKDLTAKDVTDPTEAARNEFIKNNYVTILAIAGITFISSIGLMTRYIHPGHDLEFHLLRIEGLRDALLIGNFPDRVQSNWCYGWGYAVSAMYGDLEGHRLHIQRDMILGADNTWIIKNMPKNSSSDRYIDLPEQLIDLLGTGRPDERIVPVYPSTITSDFINLRNKLQMQCRFHDMRHYYVSLAHSIGIPDRVIMNRAGFSSDRVMKAVYRNQVKADEEVYNDLWNDYMMKKLQKK